MICGLGVNPLPPLQIAIKMVMETFLFTIDYKQRQAFPFWHQFFEAITLTKNKKATVAINKYEYSPWYWTTDQSCTKGMWDFLHLSLSALFTHTRTQLFHNAASVLFTTAYQLLPIRNGTMWWMMLFQKWSLERTCLWSEFKHSSSQVSACQKKPTIEMVLSFTGETENQACGGKDGGNDCLWWCFKVCVFLCLLVLFFILPLGTSKMFWFCRILFHSFFFEYYISNFVKASLRQTWCILLCLPPI